MAEYKTIEEQFLPREMKQDMCLSLLENLGAEKINLRDARDEIIHCCVMPWHDESKPSASLNFEKLTYRCLGCHAKGGFLWLIATALGLEAGGAREWLAGASGLGGAEFQLGPLLDFLDSLEDAMKERSRGPVSLPQYSDKVLDPWNHICPLLTTGAPDLGLEGRGIPEANLIEARVGWNLDENRVVIPFWMDGVLVGWQSRRLLADGSPKYRSTEDFPRDSSIYGLPEDKSRVIVVESPMSRLRHMHHAPVAATWGSAVTDKQIQLLKWYREVVFFVDNDTAGWKVVEGWIDDNGEYQPGAAQKLAPYTQVTAVEYDWHADPAEMDDDLFDELVAARVPLSIWEKPTGCLRCIACKQKHSGPCS